MASDAQNLSLAAFTALGTIVGYLGTEVGLRSIFERLLWPSRFFNDTRLPSVLGIALLMPMGGPIHKAAIEALDTFHERGLWRGLWRGRTEGNMLGSVFYQDSGSRWVYRMPQHDKNRREARNALWVRVLTLVSARIYSSTDPTKSKVRSEIPTTSKDSQVAA